MTPKDIRIQWRELATQPLRQRDIATQLGISEAELLASCVGIKEPEREITQLDINSSTIENLLHDLPELDHVMALTRNESCVHEKKGPYKNVETASPYVVTVYGKQIDLRIFQQRWKYGFAITEKKPKGIQKSLQFYLADGSATHKIFLDKESNHEAFIKLRERYMSEKQISAQISIQALKPVYPISTNVDISQFQKDWKNIKNTHDFFSLLKNHGISRIHALRIAPTGCAVKINNTAIQKMLERVSSEETGVMVFTSNAGCMQIHSGMVKNIKIINHWLNVLDPDFSLHLRMDHIAETWIVRKSTSNGIITSLELYDTAGEMILQLFDEHLFEGVENQQWRDLIAQLEQEYCE